MIRLLVVDDHAVVRHGLRQILEAQSDIRVEAEAKDGDEALAALLARPVDAVILDIGLPGRNGLEVLGEIRRVRPGLPVLVLSMYPEDQLALRMLKAGAAGYLMKETVPDELVSAVRRVLRGRRYVSETLAEMLAAGAGTDPGPDHERLSDREFDVFLRLAAGERPKEIGAALGLSVKTVSTHRSRILEKLGLRTNADLTLYAASHGLLKRPPGPDK